MAPFLGTKMAPSYANLFMGRLEEDFLSRQPTKPAFWRRFIDDIFMIWYHGPEQLESFLADLNSWFSVKFTWSFSETTATFLDVDINISNGSLHTSVHIKPTNHQQYLHYSSCHPHHTKQSLPYSLSVRGRRICSDRESLDTFNQNLSQALVRRGYPEPLIEKQLNKPVYPRPQPDPCTSNPTINLTTTFFPGLYKLNNILKTSFPILTNSPLTHDLLPKPPSVTYRRPPNLRNLVVHTNPSSTRTTNLPPGMHPCNRRVPQPCKTCPIINPSTSFTSPVTNVSYPISSSTTCTSSNLIYVLECTQCEAFYVGETKTLLSLRLNNHRSSVNHTPASLPVAIHARSHELQFNNCFTVRPLRLLSAGTSDCDRRIMELAYQYVLRSRYPPGINHR